MVNGQDIGEPEYFYWQHTETKWRTVNGFAHNKRFVIFGTVVPEPTSYALTLVAWLTVVARRTRNRCRP